MIEAWRTLLYCDEDHEAKNTRDPVAPATRSKEALQKATPSDSKADLGSIASTPCSSTSVPSSETRADAGMPEPTN